MKTFKRQSSSTLFLLELIIALFFFTVASAVCVQFFVKAHNMSEDSQELNFAVNECCSVAEIIRASSSEAEAEEEIDNLYPGYDLQAIYFDNNMKLCKDTAAAFRFKISFETDSDTMVAQIAMNRLEDSKTIYKLEVKRNVQF